MDDMKSLSHTKWNCKYHIVFAPKFRRKIIYGELRKEIGEILRQLCEWKGIKIVEAELCPDHIHMLMEIPPKESVSGFVGYLKGKDCRGCMDYSYTRRTARMARAVMPNKRVRGKV